MNSEGSVLKDHEKLIAFMFLGFAVLILALLAYIYPPADKSGAQRIIDAAMGGLLLALGGAGNALFRITNNSEQQAIAEKTATEITRSNKPLPTKVVNTEAEPVPTAPADGELAEEGKL